MKRRHFLGLSVASILASWAVMAAADDTLPAIRSHTLRAEARIEKSPQDGGERLLISDGKQDFAFFYASYDPDGHRSSPFPFILQAGKTYTFTIEERPFPRIDLKNPQEEKPGEYFWTPVLVRITDGADTVHDMEICELHHCRMERKEVSITYGLVRLQKGLPSLDEEKALFPHRRDYVFGGCIVMPGKRTETMYICPECRTAYDAWRKAHPEPAQ